MKRTAVTIGFVYFAAMAVMVTFPGIQPFNRIRPFIFGLPFVFAWVLAWVVGSVAVFYLLHHTSSK
ncbi:MAG: DUF3311 domain-containing protein [Gemmatimonadetes bacterium]|nr:DUF3311 domain-containing protein [Gemmatimonadota bacterium]